MRQPAPRGSKVRAGLTFGGRPSGPCFHGRVGQADVQDQRAQAVNGLRNRQIRGLKRDIRSNHHLNVDDLKMRGTEKHFQEWSAKLQIPRLPRISCLSAMGSAKLMRSRLAGTANEVIFGAA